MNPPEDMSGASRPQWSVAGDAPPEEGGAEPHAPATPDDRYERHELLGVGGMGRVVLARDRRLARWVALKEVHGPDLARADLAALTARLRHEAALTARLDHPGIVPIYDVGELSDGTLYYTMRVVRGRSLEAALATAATAPDHGGAPTPRDVAGLVRHVQAACEAVGFAHRLGVVHRDLKPSNIMIGEFGETQVVDWGLGAELARSPRGAAGTPRYMAPEQASGGVIDARADVFALGLIVRALLPERGAEELRAIAERASAPEPDLRYPDAKALADDLSRWLEGRRVAAYDYGLRQHLVRFVRAWRVPLAIALFALLVVIGVVVVAFVRTEAARERAVRAEAELREALAHASENLAALLSAEAARRHREGARPEAEVLAAHAFALVPGPEARAILMANDAPRPVPERITPLPPGCVEPTIVPGGRSVLCRTSTALTWWDLEPLGARFTLTLPTHARPTPLDAGRFVVSTPAALEVYDDHGRRVTRTPRIEITPNGASDGAGHVAMWAAERAWFFGPDGTPRTIRRCAHAPPLVIAPGPTPVVMCADGTLPDALDDDDPNARARATGVTGAAALAQAGAEVIVATHDGRVIALDGERVRFSRESGLQPILEILVAPDHRVAAVRGERDGIALIDLETGAWLGRLPRSAGRAARFTDAHTLVTAGDALVRWRLPPPRPLVIDAGGGVTSVDVRGPAEQPIVAFAADRALETGPLDARTRVEVEHAITLKDLALGPDGRALAAVASGIDGIVHLDDDLLALRGNFDRARRIGRLEGPSGAWLVTLCYGGPVIASRPDASVEHIVVGPDGALGDHHDLAVAPGHRHAAVVSADEGRVRRLTWTDDEVIVDRDAPLTDASAIAIERDGEHLWAALGDRLARFALHDPEGATRVAEIASVGNDWIELAVSDLGALGTWLAAGDRRGSTWLWRIAEDAATLVARFDDHDGRVAALAFSPDASFFASGSWDRRVRLRGLGEAHAPAHYERAWGLTLEDALGTPRAPSGTPSRILPAHDPR